MCPFLAKISVPDPKLTQEFIVDSSLSALMKRERRRMGCSVGIKGAEE